MLSPATTDLPVVVIGAGPTGLAAAAHLREHGLTPLVLEQGPAAANAVRGWSHVRLFSTWAELTDPAAEKLLAPTGWARPDPGTYPTGGDWTALYLQPLADALGDAVRYDATVTGVSRLGRDRIVDADRDIQPFTVHYALADGREQRVLARAVIDASGTWSLPSPPAATDFPPSVNRQPPTASPTASPTSKTLPRAPVTQESAPPSSAPAPPPSPPWPHSPTSQRLTTGRARTRCGCCAAASPARPSGVAAPTSSPPAAPWASLRRPPSMTAMPTPSPGSAPT